MPSLRFRSPLLSPMPIDRAEGRAGRVSRRLIALAILATVVIGLILIVAFRVLPSRGPGYPLYWFHDVLYLPWKGYTVTQFFPDSLIWWGAFATLVGLWLLTYTTDRSLVRQPQIALIRRSLKRPRLHPVLYRSAAWLTRLHIRPGLLMAIVAQEREVVLARVLAAPLQGAAIRDCMTLLDLTSLLLDLMALPPISDAARLEAAAIWHETFLAARVFGPADSARSQKRLKALVERRQSFSTAFPPEPDAQPFSPAALVADLDRVAHLWQAPDDSEQTRIERARLADSLQRRQHLLFDAYARLEQRELRARAGATPPSLGLETLPPLPTEGMANLGRLALGLSLDLAHLAATPELALASIDALEGLHFALALAPAGRYPLLAAVIADLPRPQDYALVAQLAGQSLRQREDAWQTLVGQEDSPLHAADFRQAGAQLTSLAHAAGPAAFATDGLSE